MKISENQKELIDTYGEPTVEMISELFIEGVAGAIIPGVTSFITASRTRRIEKNMNIFMARLSNEIKENRISAEKMTDEKISKFRDDLSEVILDYISDERDEEKIEYVVQGFKKLINENNSIDNTSLYFDVLKELRSIDILVLKKYDYFTEEYFNQNFNDFLESLHIDYDQFKFIREKLLRNGLLISSTDEEYDKIVEFVLELSKSLKNPKKTLSNKVLSPKVKKAERIKLSKFGRAFITFFTDQSDDI